jgi:hypothetical protein
MDTLELKYTTSRGRETWGYNICSLWVNGKKVSSCNGGGYDMKGTALGNWVARAYADRLLKLTPDQMDKQSHYDYESKTRKEDGRYFYGLTYHDPTYNPGSAIIGKDTTDRTLGNSEGETVEQAEKAGKSVGLERYQAFYSASSKTPTEKHIVPLIDGACGFSSVEAIMKAIGLTLEYVHTLSKKSDIYLLHDAEVKP